MFAKKVTRLVRRGVKKRIFYCQTDFKGLNSSILRGMGQVVYLEHLVLWFLKFGLALKDFSQLSHGIDIPSK